MCCFSCGWSSGRRVWWAMHDAQAGIDDLEIEGEMPAGFDEIRPERLDRQPKVEAKQMYALADGTVPLDQTPLKREGVEVR